MEKFPDREHDPPGPNIPELENRGAAPNCTIAELRRPAPPRKISWAEPEYTSREYTEPGCSDSIGDTDIDGLARTLERTNPFDNPRPQPGEFTAQAVGNRLAAEAHSQKKSNLKPTHRRTNSEPTPAYDRRAGASPALPNFANPFAAPPKTNGSMTPDEMSGRFSPQLMQSISSFHRTSFARDSPSPSPVSPRRKPISDTLAIPTTSPTNSKSSSSPRISGAFSFSSASTSSSSAPTRLPPRYQQRTLRYEQELATRARQAHRNMVENQLNLRPTQQERDRIVIAKRKKKKETEETRETDLRNLDEF